MRKEKRNGWKTATLILLIIIFFSTMATLSYYFYLQSQTIQIGGFKTDFNTLKQFSEKIPLNSKITLCNTETAMKGIINNQTSFLPKGCISIIT
jgi:Tfp pilus assembly protein PilO